MSGEIRAMVHNQDCRVCSFAGHKSEVCIKRGCIGIIETNAKKQGFKLSCKYKQYAPKQKTMKEKVYISGAIKGVKNYAHIFNLAEAKLKANGFKVLNPCKCVKAGKSDIQCFKEAVKMLLTADKIFMLEGWQKSEGACAEFLVSQRCGMQEVCEEDLK